MTVTTSSPGLGIGSEPCAHDEALASGIAGQVLGWNRHGDAGIAIAAPDHDRAAEIVDPGPCTLLEREDPRVLGEDSRPEIGDDAVAQGVGAAGAVIGDDELL